MSLPELLEPKKPNPTIHIVFAYSYARDFSVPMDYWIDVTTSHFTREEVEEEFWLDDFIDADPEHIHDAIRHYNMPDDACGVFEFVGKIQTGRSCWEATFDDDAWLEGTVTQLYKVEEHV